MFINNCINKVWKHFIYLLIFNTFFKRRNASEWYPLSLLLIKSFKKTRCWVSNEINNRCTISNQGYSVTVGLYFHTNGFFIRPLYLLYLVKRKDKYKTGWHISVILSQFNRHLYGLFFYLSKFVICYPQTQCTDYLVLVFNTYLYIWNWAPILKYYIHFVIKSRNI